MENMINKFIARILPLLPKFLVKPFAKKYIAGSYLKDAVKLTKDFSKVNGMTTIDVLGEFVKNKKQALSEKDENLTVLEEIHKNKLSSYLSVKPTSLGLAIDYDFCFDNIKELLEFASKKNIFIRLDMENSPYTDNTLRMYKEFRELGFDNIGFVIQAYLKRSINDLMNLSKYKPNTRICKGIYVEDASIAIKDKNEINENFKKLLVYMFNNEYYPAIASHDDELISFSLKYISENNIKNDYYEFQMLLGVKENLRDEILAADHKLRIYVPYGEDWYGYSMRRLNENPAIVGHVIKSIIK